MNDQFISCDLVQMQPCDAHAEPGDDPSLVDPLDSDSEDSLFDELAPEFNAEASNAAPAIDGLYIIRSAVSEDLQQDLLREIATQRCLSDSANQSMLWGQDALAFYTYILPIRSVLARQLPANVLQSLYETSS